MKLTVEQNDILNGKYGPTLKKCLQSLKKYGEFYESDRFLPITSAHLAMSGGSRLFETYLEIMGQLASEGVKFKVPTSLNPRYMTENPFPFEKMIFNRQEELEGYFKQMQGIENFSCAPYFGENLPERGDIVAWSESNAVIYINSVIGAKTNRTSVIIDLFSAVLGLTPNFGLLIDENRKADYEIIIDVNEAIDYSLLGYIIGEQLIDKIPYIRGLTGNCDDLKNMGAAMAASGGLGLYHIENLTPEAIDLKEEILKKDYNSITITSEMLKELHDRLSQGRKKTDLVFIGCPHLSYDELIIITKMITGRKVKNKLWLNSSPFNIRKFKESIFYNDFEKTGAEIVSICPITLFNSLTRNFRWVLTNSGKIRYYSPIYYGSLLECLTEAIGGDSNEI